jgi:hypothetical protein
LAIDIQEDLMRTDIMTPEPKAITDYALQAKIDSSIIYFARHDWIS